MNRIIQSVQETWLIGKKLVDHDVQLPYPVFLEDRLNKTIDTSYKD